MLGNLYAAECLILMDKINEAIDHLMLQNLEDLSTFIPVPDALDQDQTAECIINTKSKLLINLFRVLLPIIYVFTN